MSKRLNPVWDSQSNPVVNARKHLPPLISDYFRRARKTLAGNASTSDLHALRLATKRLRYTLELFRSCYGPGLAARLDALQQIQQLLGDISDGAAVARLLSKHWKRKSLQRTRVEEFLQQKQQAKTAELKKYWGQHFDAPGQERRWIRYLAGAPPRSGRERPGGR